MGPEGPTGPTGPTGPVVVVSQVLSGGVPVAAPRAIGIVGLGLIGTSVALAARRRWPDVRVIGVDRAGVFAQRRVTAACDECDTSLQVLAEAEIVVLAVPVDAAIETLPRLAAVVPSSTVVTDTGSTKRAVVAAATGLDRFVGGHPMAGGEQGGPDHARVNLFDGRTWWIVPGDASATRVVRAFVEGVGAAPVEIDAARHDALMAAVSHLPQVVASALMVRVGAAVGEEGLRQAGAGLRDTTRLAASSGEMWASVLGTNADALAPLLRDLAGDLDRIAGQLDDGDAVRRLFADAMRRRDLLPK
jgi:prephenate dehydrogenase